MNWEMIAVIIAALGLLITIIVYIVKVSNGLGHMSGVIEALVKSLDELTMKNSESHERIWDKIEDQCDTLTDHEKRIYSIEQNKESK